MKPSFKNPLILTTLISITLLSGCVGNKEQSSGGGNQQATGEGGSGENNPLAPSISIHEAAEKGDLEAIKKHITAGTNINSTEWRDGETPLHRAITRGQTEAAKLLIEKGCNINLGRIKDGETPLDMAED